MCHHRFFQNLKGVICIFLIFLWLPFSSGQAATSGQTLQDLAGWKIPFLGSLPVKEFSTENNYASGKIDIAGKSWSIMLFKAEGETQANLAIGYDQPITLASLLPRLKGTPLDMLEMKAPVLLYVPDANAGHQLNLPVPLSKRLGKTSLTLRKGVNLQTLTRVHGEVEQLFKAAGINTDQALPLSGSIDPSVFSGAGGKGIVTEQFWQNLDISMPLKSLAPAWRPSFLAFGESVMKVSGVQDERGEWIPRLGIATSASVTLAASQKLDFGYTMISWRKDGKLDISSDGIVPSKGLFGLPSANEIKVLRLASVVAADGASYQLQGQMVVHDALESFDVALRSVDNQLDYSLSIQGNISLAQLTGWTVPALGEVSVSSVTLSKAYSTGSITIANQPWTLTVFRAGAQHNGNIALTYDRELRLSTLMPALAGTPLDALELQNPTFILAAPENIGQSVQLPRPLAARLHTQTIALKDGLKLQANAHVFGEAGELLTMVGINSSSGLPLGGSFDPSLLASGKGAAKSLTQAFLENLNIAIPLTGVRIPGLPGFVSFNARELVIQGMPEGKGISTGIASDVAVNMNQSRLLFDSTVFLGSDKGNKFLKLQGHYHGDAWHAPLGISFLTLRDVKLAIDLGASKAIAIDGLTDVGAIRNLDAIVKLALDGDHIKEAGIELLGADIPLSSLPGIQSIPNSNLFAIRDLYLTNTSIAGTFKTKEANLAALNGLSGAIFQQNGAWNLALLKNNFSFGELLPLPAPARKALAPLTLKKAVIMISQHPLEASIAQLPDAARHLFSEVYGSESGHLKLDGGLQMMAAIDLGSFGKSISALTPGGGSPVFSGGIGGLFGGVPTIDLELDMPTIQFPPSLGFIQLPKSFTAYQFIELTESAAAVGVGVDTEILVHAKPEPIDFISTVRFEANTLGGFAIDLQGKTNSRWESALGIQGLEFEPGTRLEVKAEVSGDITVTFVGITRMGRKAVELIGSASVNVALGVLDKGAFEGKIDSISFNDVMSLTNRVVTAAGGQPMHPDFPNATLRNADIAFASPGVDIPEIHLAGGGIRIEGDLWVLFKDAPAGDVFAQIDGSGIIMKGDIHDFNLGTVALKNNKLDVKAVTFPPEAYFKINSGGTLFGAKADMDVILSTKQLELASHLDMGALLKFDFRAYTDMPDPAFTPEGLMAADLGLSSHLKSDISAWVNTSGMQSVEKALAVMSQGLGQAHEGLEKAQKDVNTLDSQIAQMRQTVAGERSSQSSQIDKAKSTVDYYVKQVSALNSDINSAKSHLHTCRYTYKACVWRNLITRKCTKHAYLPNLGKNARCASDNVKYGAIVASKTTLKATADAARIAADEVLSDVKKGLKTLPVDADPRVAALIAAKETALKSLQAAEATVDGTKSATDQVSKALAFAKVPGTFAIKDSIVQGSLKKSIAGTPSVIGLDFNVLGHDYYNGFALSMTDPVFTANQLEGLALFIVMKAVESAPQASPVLVQFLHDSYVKKHAETDAKLQQAMVENGLD